MTNHLAALTALADPTRRAIFERLAQAPSPVGELARDLPVSRPAVSQHLKVLKAAGLVSERRDGTRRLYLARQDEMHKLRDFLDDYWTTGLERLRDVAEAAQRNKGATDGRAHP